MATYLKANNTNNLDTTASWATSTVPGTSDIGRWESTVTGANTVSLGSNQSWAGLIVSNPGGLVTINAGNTLTIGTSGIDMTSATQNLVLNCPLATTNGARNIAITSAKYLETSGGVTFNGNTSTITGGTWKLKDASKDLILGSSLATTITAIGLATLDCTCSTFYVNNSTAAVAVSMNLGLASTSTITAGTMKIGATGSSVSADGTLRMGETSTINCDTWVLGQKRSNGTFSFNATTDTLSTPHLTLRGTNGGSNYITSILCGDYNTSNTGQTPTGTFNLSSYDTAVVNMLCTTMTLGQQSMNGSTSAAGNPTGTFSLNGSTSTVTITTAYVGKNNQTLYTPAVACTARGTITLTNGSLTIGTLKVADYATSGLNNATNNIIQGFLAINGGTLTVNTAFVLADQGFTGYAAANAYGSLIINGGTVSVNCNMTTDPSHDYTATYPTQTILTLTTGELNMHGYNIGTANAPIGGGAGSAITWAGGTLRDVGTINGTAGLEKTTAGTLTIAGTCAWSGATTVSAGTLSVTGTISASSSCAVNAATLGGTGTVACNVTSTSGVLTPGVGGAAGILSVTGNVTLDAGSTYTCNLNGASKAADKVAATGTVICAGTLTVNSVASASSGTYTIISAGTVTGIFTGLPNNSTFSSQGRRFRIVYSPTDVTLMDVSNWVRAIISNTLTGLTASFPAGWARKVALAIDHTKVPNANQTGVPVALVWNGSTGNLPAEVYNAGATSPLSSGADIRFSSDSAGTTQLPFEIVNFSPNSTTASARVEIYVKTNVTTAADTTIYMWWKGSSYSVAYPVTHTYGRNAVWSGYTMVWHMDSSFVDVTGNGYNLTNGGTTRATTASTTVLGSSRNFNLAAQQYMAFTCTHPAVLTFFALANWTDADVYNQSEIITFDDDAMIRLDVAKGLCIWHISGNWISAETAVASLDAGLYSWCACINPAGNLTQIFYNGANPGGYVSSYAIEWTNYQGYLGSRDGDMQHSFGGDMDEIRVASVARDANWVAVEHNSTIGYATFVVPGTPGQA